MQCIKENKFIWSQTALKDFESEYTCPFRWKAQWIDGVVKFQDNLPTKLGNYFEYLCLGQTAKVGEIPTIPLTTKGEKTVAQKRVEAQADKFRDLFNPVHPAFLGYEILSTQTKLSGSISGIPIEGVADIIAADQNGNPVIIDLKLTEDSLSDRTKYNWGSPIEVLDLVQQVLYQQLYRQQFGKLPKMVLMIFEHGPRELIQIWDLTITDEKVLEMMERFRIADDVLQRYLMNGWVKTPSKQECDKCSLECDVRHTVLPVIKKSIIY